MTTILDKSYEWVNPTGFYFSQEVDSLIFGITLFVLAYKIYKDKKYLRAEVIPLVVGSLYYALDGLLTCYTHVDYLLSSHPL